MIDMMTARPATARKVMGRPVSPPTEQVRMRADLKKMLSVISSEREMGLPELADLLFRETIEREYRASIDRLKNSQVKKK